jgi:hypothetical protein
LKILTPRRGSSSRGEDGWRRGVRDTAGCHKNASKSGCFTDVSIETAFEMEKAVEAKPGEGVVYYHQAI